MLNIFDRKEKNKSLLGLKNTEFDNKKVFQYNNQVFDLTNEIHTKTQSLLKEEGLMTDNFNTLLNGTGYTTEQIIRVQQHLQNLSNNSNLTNELINQVFQSLEISSQKSNHAKTESTNMIAQMCNVTNMFEQFIVLFTELQSQYKNIENFASIISNIANQTNLLSLNASIEAARAGEQGKGFAIVANEIKKLSVDTHKNAEDIMNSIKNMTEIISQLVDKSNEGTNMVSDTTKLIENSGNVMENIIDAEKEIIQYVENVKASQDSNLKDIEEINIDLKNIIEKSEQDTNQFEILMQSVQRKADYFLYILHHLNQIMILKKQFDEI